MQTAETHPAKGTGDTRTDRHRRRRSHSSYHSRARIRRYRYLVAGISILFLLIYIFTWLHISSRSSEHEQLTLQLRKLESAYQEASAELEKIRAQRDSLVQGRIPDLLPLKFDEAISFDESYVRNVIFTLVKSGKKSIYEYRLVLSNDSLSVIRPKVEILLFNESGVQIGNAQVQANDATSDIERSTLEPGEVRSYSAAIDMMRDGEPSYFMLNASESTGSASDKLREQLGNTLID